LKLWVVKQKELVFKMSLIETIFYLSPLASFWRGNPLLLTKDELKGRGDVRELARVHGACLVIMGELIEI